ncbi:MAG TPA: alpha-(1-_3)-arabinofuranosyltransferase family protein [Solirubrobacteraceae bacterium]
MSTPRRAVGVPMFLGLVAYALAFAQRPGLATADTKINLHVDPGRFLGDVASVWTSTGQLGGVQTGQQAGYLFPMGPFFALGHLIGLPDWVVQRLWLGSVLALAAWGAVRLLDAMVQEPRGVAHLVTGLVILLNPFVVTYANRTTVTLLAYAALPWLLLAVHRGLREPGGWRWPAAVALLVTAAGGGVNGAVVAWMLLGPALLIVYEVALTEVTVAQARGFLVRAVPLGVLVSLWWVIPAYIQSVYGVNFLQFTEQPGTVWGTTSATEALRLMSFWLSYVGVGFQGRAIPYFDDSLTLLFSAPVVVATLLLPAAALGGFAGIRRWRYAPFFLGLALVAVLVMMAGFPDGTALRHGLFFTYNHVAAVRFLRASYKGAPLLAVALAVLAGVAAGALWARLGMGTRLGLVARPVLAVAVAAVLVGAAWPLVVGHAQDAQVSYHGIPAAWRQAAADLDRELPANSRAIVLPGDLFSFYTWGGTVDPILPALSSRPVAERSEVPYTNLRATDLLWTIDGLVHQQRLVPGQLGPLLSLIGARAVVSGADDDLARSDAPAPADAAAQLASQPGFARPARSYGPVTHYASATQPGATARLPQVRRYDLPSARGLIRVEPVRDPIVVDGSADGIAGLAAFSMLPLQRPILYAADLGPAALRRQVAPGGDVVITDSNRRQAFAASSLEQNTGAVLASDETVSADGLILDPFGRGPGDETVAVYGGGVRVVQAPFSPQRAQFPEHGPSAAIDGSVQTAWVADPTLDPSQRWLQVDFSLARRIASVDLVPYDDAGGSVRAVAIEGRSFAVHPGLNHLPLPPGPAVSSLRVTITAVSPPAPGATAGAGGIRELRIPGVHATEALRLPVDATDALAGADLRHTGLTYLFQRTTGDEPYARTVVAGPWSALNVADAGDAEQTMNRVFSVPARRRFAATAWVAPFASAPDPALDRLAGYRGPVTATSSDRADGQPRWRASAALDGDPRTAWLGSIAGGHTPWLAWQTPRPTTVRALRLLAASIPVARPTQVRLTWPGGATPALPVDPGGRVALPRAVSARRFRLTILTAAAPARASAADRRAVGIAEVLGVRGLPAIRAAGFHGAPCGAVRVRVNSGVIRLRVTGSAAAFAQGRPLYARACGAPVPLASGAQHLQVLGGTFGVNNLRLGSPPPAPVATAAVPPGRVVAVGTSGRGAYRGVRVAVRGPAWLVLGEGYDRGWSATCNGRSLGAPTPIDGYANGWRVGPGCTAVAFTFVPQRLATIGYIISGVAGLACLLLLLVGGWRRRDVVPDPPRVHLAAGRSAPVLEPSIIWALPAALVFGFVFGIDAGVVAAVAIAVVLWRGIGAGPLALAAGALLGIVVPVLYLLHPGSSAGGNHYGYATGHLGAHWVGVAAIGMLMAALWRTLRSQ